MDNSSFKNKVLTSLIWKFMERFGTFGIQFVVLIILARLLTPADYGIVSLVSVFNVIATVFIQSGFNIALIQKKYVDEEELSSVFFLNIAVSVFLYGVLFFMAPFIAGILKVSQLGPVIRVLAVILFFDAFNLIQNVILARNMQFKKLFFSSVGAILISGVTGIVLAYCGFGVWTLVVQQITNQLMNSLILWFTVKWRPRLIFSFAKIKNLYSFSWKIFVSELIDTVYMHIRSFLIGIIFSPEMLGYYNKGKQFPSFIVTNINGSIQSVMLPALSSKQDDTKKVKSMVRRSIVTSSYVIFPMMVGLAIISKPLISVLLTEKWLPAVPFLVIYCISFALWPLNTANLQAIKALGRGDVFLKLEIAKKIISVIILIFTLFYSPFAIAAGALVSGIISCFINAFPNKKLLDYSYTEQIRDICPSLIISVVMGAVIYNFKFLGLSKVQTLVLQIIGGFAIYVVLSMILKLECYLYLLNIAGGLINRIKPVYYFISRYRQRKHIKKILYENSEYLVSGKYYIKGGSKRIAYLDNKRTTDFILKNNLHVIRKTGREESLLMKLFRFLLNRLSVIKVNNKSEPVFPGEFVMFTRNHDFKIFSFTDRRVITFVKESEDYLKIKETVGFFKEMFPVTITEFHDGRQAYTEKYIDFLPYNRWSKKQKSDVMHHIFLAYERYFKGIGDKKYIRTKNLFDDYIKETGSDNLIYSAYEIFDYEDLERKWPLARSHGDLGFNNILLSGDKIYFIDWEESREHIFFYDLFNIIFFECYYYKDYSLLDWYIKGYYDYYFKKLFNHMNIRFHSEDRIKYFAVFLTERVMNEKSVNLPNLNNMMQSCEEILSDMKKNFKIKNLYKGGNYKKKIMV